MKRSLRRALQHTSLQLYEQDNGKRIAYLLFKGRKKTVVHWKVASPVYRWLLRFAFGPLPERLEPKSK